MFENNIRGSRGNPSNTTSYIENFNPWISIDQQNNSDEDFILLQLSEGVLKYEKLFVSLTSRNLSGGIYIHSHLSSAVFPMRSNQYLLTSVLDDSSGVNGEWPLEGRLKTRVHMILLQFSTIKYVSDNKLQKVYFFARTD